MEIKPGCQSRSRTEKWQSQSGTDFALTLQPWYKLIPDNKTTNT